MTTLVATTQINTDLILKKPYVRRLLPDPVEGYTASIQEFPGCIAEGDTAEEALQNLDKAAASWVEVSLLNGREIREPIDFDGCSGKIALRIPRSMHREVAELAELEGSSINQVLTAAIASYVSGKHVLHQVTKVLKAAIPARNEINIGSMNLSWQIMPPTRFTEISSSGEMVQVVYEGQTKNFISYKPALMSETVHG